MNLSQIERKFQELQVKENYMRYYFNPICDKVSGLKQHAYIKELNKDHKLDIQTYGMDPFTMQQKLKDNKKKNRDSQAPTQSKFPAFGGVISGPSESRPREAEEVDEEYQSQMLDGTPAIFGQESRPGSRVTAYSRPKTTSFGGTTTYRRRIAGSSANIYIAKPKNILEACD